MKKQIITLALLLIGMTGTWAQNNVNRIMASGACNVTIKQADTLLVLSEDGIANKSAIQHKMINLMGSDDYVVTLPELKDLELFGTADAQSHGTLKGENLFIDLAGASDAILEVDYDSISVNMAGSSDLTLKGRCRSLNVTALGSCDIHTENLQTDTIIMDLAGTSEWNNSGTNLTIFKNSHSERSNSREKHHSTLLYDAQWGGFEAGLNMITPGFGGSFNEIPNWLELRQMNSWCFNINIADVGIAFNHRHSMGLFTGIGIGWNNYSFTNHMFLEKDANNCLQATPILNEDDMPLNINRSKMGVFYVQMPFMLEFKPFNQKMYIDLGVTCGMRLTSWQTIKFGDNRGQYAILGEGENAEVIAADKAKELQHKDLCVNFFKVDATMRIGSVNNNLGFFVKYALLPLFVKDKAPEVYPLNIGFSINF